VEEDLSTQSVVCERVPETHLDDDILISSGLQGNRDSFDILFARYRPLLYKLAYRIMRNHEESEDAVQNCSMLAYCKMEGFKHEGAFRSWLARILVNEAIAILRKRKRYIAPPQPAMEGQEEVTETLPDPGPNPEQILARKQGADALAKKVSRLARSQRSAFLLCGIYEFTAEEASAMLKVAPSTIRSRLFRARRQLAAAMTPAEATERLA
jgi:RNA polymerase sigma-70 factor, ECF subfamily